jgi:hypothetical protein
MTVLDAIYDEIAMLYLRTDCLEQAALVLSPLYTSTPGRPRAQAHEHPKARTRGAKTQTPESTSLTIAQVRDHVIAHAPINRRELLQALNGPPTAVDKKLRRLVAKGEIAVSGQPGARVYLAPPSTAQRPSSSKAQPSSLTAQPPSSTAQPPSSSPSSRPRRPRPERGVYAVYDAVRDLGAATTRQLVEHTGLPADIVVEQGRRMVRLGLLRFTGSGDKRVWLPTDDEREDGGK